MEACNEAVAIKTYERGTFHVAVNLASLAVNLASPVSYFFVYRLVEDADDGAAVRPTSSRYTFGQWDDDDTTTMET